MALSKLTNTFFASIKTVRSLPPHCNACTEDKHPCKDERCKKKHAPCPNMPKSSPPEVEDCEEEEEIKTEGHAPIVPVPPKNPRDPNFCDTVEKLTGEKKETPSGCCKRPK